MQVIRDGEGLSKLIKINILKVEIKKSRQKILHLQLLIHH